MPDDPLTPYGWDERLAALFELEAADGHEPARVTTVHRGECDVVTREGRRRVTSPPGVGTGDWAAVDGDALTTVLPRRSELTRQRSDDADQRQVIAANVDVVLITVPLDRDVNLNRLERELVVAWESGAEPAVALTKADLHPDPQEAVQLVFARDPRVDVVVTSAVAGTGVDEIAALLQPHRTVVLLGSSGAGKSTIVNRLLGAAVQETAEVRAGDAKGRHTTTTRDLLLVPSGGVLIDTPGIRGLLLWSAGDGLSAAFPDIEDLADTCRFRDCDHGPEPGCAVRAAIASGDLSPERLASYQKLKREVAWAQRSVDPAAAAEERKRWKQIHKEVRGRTRP
ncbi:MAG: ribosome small subunit-dependent GTPase A [Actinomycetota bacterium]|nr:ribosome small subunit-dependent GTPase A [Actinomycetota bacterium]